MPRKAKPPEPTQGTDDTGYAVGYGKPPSHSRFQPGKSGNPHGRPKGSRNLASTMARELGALVSIQENGKRRSITKLEAIVKQQVNRAATGDSRSAQFVLGLSQFIESSPALAAQPLSSEADKQVMQEMLKRMRRTGGNDVDT